jgi:hypothetical protein
MQLNATLAPGREANKAGEQAGCAVVNWPKGEVEGRKQKAESRKQKAESRKQKAESRKQKAKTMGRGGSVCQRSGLLQVKRIV